MKVILNEDFQTLLSFMQRQIGVTEENVRAYVRSLKAGGVDLALLNLNCQTSMVPSEVMETVMDRCHKTEVDGVPVNFTTEGLPSFVHELYATGKNFWEIYFDELKKCGIGRGITLRMNDCHEPRRETEISSLRSDFMHNARRNGMTTCAHREIIGYYDDTLDYAAPAVRQLMLDYLDEQLKAYDAEYVELDFMREAVCFKPGHEDEGREILRGFFREVRRIADRFESLRGHKIKLAIRTYPDPLNDRLSCIDAVGLAREGLVDLVTPTGRFQSNVDNMPLAFWRELLPEGCMLAMGTEMCLRVLPYDWSLTPMRTPEHVYAMTHYANASGADAIYLFNDTERWKILDPARTEYLKRLADPRAVAAAPRRHTLGLSELFPDGGFGYQPLPLPLSEYFYDGNKYPRLVFSTGAPTGDMYILLAVNTVPEDLCLYMNASPVDFIGYTKVEKDFSKDPVLVYRVRKEYLKALRQVLEIRALSCGRTVTFAEMRNEKPSVE